MKLDVIVKIGNVMNSGTFHSDCTSCFDSPDVRMSSDVVHNAQCATVHAVINIETFFEKTSSDYNF
jgi:hypothetical protein